MQHGSCLKNTAVVSIVFFFWGVFFFRGLLDFVSVPPPATLCSFCYFTAYSLHASPLAPCGYQAAVIGSATSKAQSRSCR